ncbi:hypothetical protein IFM89_030691 [Coptis chinensis]|uniref:Pentatricopeptide repeat-containing protein n=1 Tax=Coptis chinensis TaxID=261450 RepID=A0A835J2Q8_9MAGN|nr:hypothetical protein IFM89_030691 [Coptis chinensis]
MSNRDVVTWTALVSAYAKCGMPDEARCVFYKMPERNAVSWAAVVSGYSQCGRHDEALSLFNETRRENVEPTEGMLISVLSSSGYLGVLEVGKWVHDYVKCNGILLTASIGTALLSMYAKCGCIDDAICVFMEMPRRDALSWTAMISALSMHGKGQQGLACFDEMLSLGLRPDHVTFVGVLSACSHAGFVEEEWAAMKLLELDQDSDSPYTLLGNAYASVGRWADAERVRKMMRIRRVVKTPGCSLVEIDGVVHQFVAGNNEEHPKMEEIKSLLHEMGKNLGLADHTCD